MFSNMFGHPRRYRNANGRNESGTSEMQNFKTYDGVPVHTLYVTNIPLIAQRELFSVFKPYGEIFNIDVMPVTLSGKKFTYGFVTFRRSCDAFSAFKARYKLRLKGFKLYIHVADSWHQPKVCSNGTLKLPSKFLDKVSSSWKLLRERLFETNEEEEEESGTEESCFEVEDQQTAPIYKLNDDCLRMIFSYLSLNDKVFLDQVCRRWKNVIGDMFASIRELDFSKGTNHDFNLTNDNLSRLLQKLVNLSSLNLCAKKHNLSSMALVSVAKNCQNLESLSIKGINLSRSRSLVLLGRSCNKLKHFEMKECPFESSRDFVSFIKRCKHLEVIRLCRVNFIRQHSWLANLSPPLKTLSIDGCNYQIVDFIKGLGKVKDSLRELEFSLNKSIRVSDMQKIFAQVENLTSFSMSAMFASRSGVLGKLPTLKYLTKLELERSEAVTDELLENLVKSCQQIEKLTLIEVESSNLTTNGLAQVVKFPKLTHLAVPSNPLLVTDVFLKMLSQSVRGLIELNVSADIHITDSGLANILNQCNELEVLNFSNCPSVTGSTVKTAKERCESSARTKKLKLIAGGSGVDTNINWDCPNCSNLKVEFSCPGGNIARLYDMPRFLMNQIYDLDYDELEGAGVLDILYFDGSDFLPSDDDSDFEGGGYLDYYEEYDMDDDDDDEDVHEFYRDLSGYLQGGGH